MYVMRFVVNIRRLIFHQVIFKKKNLINRGTVESRMVNVLDEK